MKRIIFTTACFIFTCCSFAQKRYKKASFDFSSFDTAFARVHTNFKVPGFALAIVYKQQVIYSKGFGYKDFETKNPVTPNTLFAIGSCTKAFTAGLLGILNKDGKVDFDKPVKEYLPSLKFYNAEMDNDITLRDMMSHRTGLPRHDFSWYFFPTESRDSLMQRIQYMEPSAKLRVLWQYNNFMFMLQGMVTEKLTAKSWEENIKEKFFQPLGMDRSDASLTDWMKTEDVAKGYGLSKDSIIEKLDYYNIAAMAPAGAINSSANDMAKWITAWINGGKYNGKEVLPEGYTAQAISSQMVINGALPTAETPDVFFANYGFGWFLSSYRGHYRVEHGGNIDGFSANACFFPADSIGIIVLCNQNGSAVPSVIRNIAADKLLGLHYIDWDSKIKNQLDKSKAADTIKKEKDTTAKYPPTHLLKNYTGTFQNKGYGTLHVQIIHDSLQAVNALHPVFFRHKTYDIFEAFVKDKSGFDTANSTIARFEMDNNGNINKLTMELEGGVKPIEFLLLPDVKPVPKDSLKKYTGTYEIAPGAIAKVYIKSDSVLYLFVPGQPEYELLPTDTNKFTIKILTGYSVQFNPDAVGKITEVLFIQPNGTFKAEKKEK